MNYVMQCHANMELTKHFAVMAKKFQIGTLIVYYSYGRLLSHVVSNRFLSKAPAAPLMLPFGPVVLLSFHPVWNGCPVPGDVTVVPCFPPLLMIVFTMFH